MKVRVGLVLVAAAGAFWLSGCQSSAAKAETPGGSCCVAKDAKNAVDAEKPTMRTIRNRDPKTGEIITKEVPVTTTSAPKPTSSAPTRTIRTRDPQTGRTITKEVPVTTPDAPDEKPEMRTIRTRDPKTGQTITKQVPVTTTSPPKPAQEPFEITWSEKCSVEQAFNATNRLLYETLGLKKVIPSGSKYFQEPVSDYMSARLKACSTIGIQFDVNIFLMSPEMTSITVKATSSTQPAVILEKHTLFIRSKISEAIAQEPEVADTDSIPFPKIMILDRSTSQVYKEILNWIKKAELQNIRPPGGDKYYTWAKCRCASGIEFYFQIRMIDSDKTKLIIDVKNYEGKEEFNVILKSLEEALTELDKPAEAVDEAAATSRMQSRFG